MDQTRTPALTAGNGGSQGSSLAMPLMTTGNTKMADKAFSTSTDYVNVPVTPSTRRRLRIRKAQTGETYDETLNRLLDARGDDR